MEELLKLIEKNPFVALGFGIGGAFWMLGKLSFLKKPEKSEKEDEISWRKIALQQSSTISDMTKLINEMKIELEKRKLETQETEKQIGD